MDDLEQELYVGIMEGTTGSIGINQTSPFIVSTCTILDQQLGSNTDGEVILQVTYNMNYSTHYGHEIIYEYPEYFRLYMNSGGANISLTIFYDVIDVPNWNYVLFVGPTVFHSFSPSPTYKDKTSMPPIFPPSDIGEGGSTFDSELGPATQATTLETTENGGDAFFNISKVSSNTSLFIGIAVGVFIAIVSVIAAFSFRSYTNKVKRRKEGMDDRTNRNRPPSTIVNYSSSSSNNESSAAMIAAAVTAAHPDQTFARSAALIVTDQFSGFCMDKRRGSGRENVADASITGNVGVIIIHDEEDGGVNAAGNLVPTIDSSFSTADAGANRMVPSDVVPSPSLSPRELIIVEDNEGEGKTDLIDKVSSPAITVGSRRENTTETMARLLLHKQSDFSDVSATASNQHPTPSGLFIDPTTIDYSTIIELNDAEAGYIMTTTESSSDMPYPELMSTMTAARQSSNNLVGMGDEVMYASDVGPSNEVFASEIMIQTGLLVDPATIDYAESLLVAESVTDVVVGEERVFDGTIEETGSSTTTHGDKQHPVQGGTLTSDNLLGSVNLMAIRSDSFSSNDDTLEDEEHLLFSPHGFATSSEKYADSLLDRRLGLLEDLRVEVTSAVDGVGEMLSLAIARISSDIADGVVAPPPLDWIGGEDLGSIEASCLCHTFTWDRKRMSDDKQSFFEDVMNKVVLLVHHGLLEPYDCARILHGCASIVGLTLLKELPNTTVAVQGLLKTNDLVQGHHLLVTTFEQFGEIVDASIAPQNRGFGFVRFLQSESVEAVLYEQKVSEIEIEDVAISIKTLLRRKPG